MNDFTYCGSNLKQKGLCENCKRNIDLDEVERTTWLSSWTPYKAKNFKTKITKFKCDGFSPIQNKEK